MFVHSPITTNIFHFIIIGDDHQLPSVVNKCGNGKGAIYYYDKAKRKRRTDTKRNLVENGGMNRFLDCAKKVIELKTNYRTEEGEQELHAMLDKLREGDTLSEEQVQTLRRLHINNFSSNDMNTILEIVCSICIDLTMVEKVKVELNINYIIF